MLLLGEPLLRIRLERRRVQWGVWGVDEAEVPRLDAGEGVEEVDVIVATEQEFFDEILPRMFEPMTDEQRFFNEQVAVIERNKQSALAAQQAAFEASLRH